MLVNTSWDSVETDHIYMTSSSPSVSNSCYNRTKISLKLLGLTWTSSMSQWPLWWQELFLPQAEDGAGAESGLIPTISWRSYSGFTLVRRRPQVEVSGDSSNLCLTLPPDAGKWVSQKYLSCSSTTKPHPKGREDAATIGERSAGKVGCPRRCAIIEQTCSLCCRFSFLCEWFRWVWTWVIHHHCTITKSDRSKLDHWS